MVSIHMLALYLGAVVMIYALPGPDMALVMQTSSTRGLRHGLATAAGLAAARSVHVLLSACGVAALLQSAPWLYQTVRIVGGLYLAYLAVQIFRSPGFGLTAAAGSPAAPPSPLLRSAGRGLLNNLLNPKALLFCSVLLPQFIIADAAPVWAQVAELGVLLVAAGTAFDVLFALGSARIAGWLQRHPRAQTLQRWAFSAALMGFAARLSLA